MPVKTLKLLRLLLIIGIISILLIICLLPFLRRIVVDSYIQFLQLEPIAKPAIKLVTESDITKNYQAMSDIIQMYNTIIETAKKNNIDNKYETLIAMSFVVGLSIIVNLVNPVMALGISLSVPVKYFLQRRKENLFFSDMELAENKCILMVYTLNNLNIGLFLFVYKNFNSLRKKFNLRNSSEVESVIKDLDKLLHSVLELKKIKCNDEQLLVSLDIAFKKAMNSHIETLYNFPAEVIYFLFFILIVLLLLVIIITVIIIYAERKK